MIRYLLAVAILVTASCLSANAAEPVMKADPGYGVLYAQEQVVTLPQDRHKPYLTLFGDRNDPRFQEIVQWFDESLQDRNQTLTGIKAQTHYNVIYSDTPLYRERYAKTISMLPCVRLQAVDEVKPIAEYSGLSIPMTADALARGLNVTATASECFRRWRSDTPDPGIAPPLNVDPPAQPLLPPAPTGPTSPTTPWLLLGILATVGALLGGAGHFREVYYARKA